MLLTRPWSSVGVARRRIVADSDPHVASWTPNATSIAPATATLVVAPSTKWVAVSMTSPARSRVVYVKRRSSRSYSAAPISPPTALALSSRPNPVSPSCSRSNAYSTRIE